MAKRNPKLGDVRYPRIDGSESMLTTCRRESIRSLVKGRVVPQSGDAHLLEALGDLDIKDAEIKTLTARVTELSAKIGRMNNVFQLEATSGESVEKDAK